MEKREGATQRVLRIHGEKYAALAQLLCPSVLSAPTITCDRTVWQGPLQILTYGNDAAMTK